MFDALPELGDNIFHVCRNFDGQLTSKSFNVVFDPLNSNRLILETEVSGHTRISSRQEPQWPKAVVHRHHNDLLGVHEIVSSSNTWPTRSSEQTAPVDVNENWQLALDVLESKNTKIIIIAKQIVKQFLGSCVKNAGQLISHYSSALFRSSRVHQKKIKIQAFSAADDQQKGSRANRFFDDLQNYLSRNHKVCLVI